jgi:hypothetical protein
MIHYKKLLPLILFLCIFAQISIGQSTLKGTVTDAQTGEPLPGVNVYLSGTTYGVSTNETGYYKLSISDPGTYNLVFSFVGYGKKVRRIEINASSSETRNISLKEDIQQLGEIEVKSSNKKWKERYNYFFKQFIGRTDFADQVTIENPWVLSFEKKDDMLKATAQKPLKIINKALGYKLYVELVDFRWPTYSNRGGGYKILPRFELLTPESAQQELRWKKNRIRSYLGSFNHFLKTLYNNELDESHFTVRHQRNIAALPQGETQYELLGHGNISEQRRRSLKGYKLKRRIETTFNRHVEFTFNRKTFSLAIYKEGAIEPNTKNRVFFVDEYGALLNPLSLIAYGDWADARVAYSLPTNYSVGD